VPVGPGYLALVCAGRVCRCRCGRRHLARCRRDSGRGYGCACGGVRRRNHPARSYSPGQRQNPRISSYHVSFPFFTTGLSGRFSLDIWACGSSATLPILNIRLLS